MKELFALNDEVRRQNLHISKTPSCLDFRGKVDLFKDIMLITMGCGRGKTYWALSNEENGALDRINKERKHLMWGFFSKDNKLNLHELDKSEWQPEDVWFITSRAIIKNQQLQKNINTVGLTSGDMDLHAMDFEQIKGKIKVATAHAVGTAFYRGILTDKPKLIIIDEIHSIFQETGFAWPLFYFLVWLKENQDSMIKIGLTATPEFLEDYIQKESDWFNFSVLDRHDYGSKYLSDNVVIVQGGLGTTILDNINIDSENKVLFYTQSAKRCYDKSKLREDASFLVSDYCETTAADTDGESCLVLDKMREHGHKDYLIEHGKFPDDVNIMFINSACREGLDIDDDKIKTIVCEAVDIITIQQILGRVRQNIDNFYVVANGNHRENAAKELEKALTFSKEYVDAANKEAFLAERVGKQKKDKYLTNLAFELKDRGEFVLNSFAYGYIKYQNDCYKRLQGSFFGETVSKAETGELLRTILPAKQYFQHFTQFAKNGEIKIMGMDKLLKSIGNKNKVEVIDEKWLNIPLGAQEKKEMCAALGLSRTRNRAAGWRTLKKELLAAGYQVKTKRVGTKTYDVITLT